VVEAASGRRGAAILGALAIAAAAPVPWPAPVAAGLLAAALGYAPGALLAPYLVPRFGPAGRSLFAFATAPFLSGGAMAILLTLRVRPADATRFVLASAAAAAFVAWRWPMRTLGERAGREGAVPWLAAGVWTAGVALLLIGNPWLAPRSDGWFHAAVALQMADRPGVPEDPYFAGLRLLYFWGYHAWAVAWLAPDRGLAVWAPFTCLNLTGAAAVIFGVCLIARRLGAGRVGTWAAAGVATLGYAPFGWLWIGVRMLTGDVQGLEELRRLTSLGVSPPLQIMSTWMLHSSMAFFGDKFLVLTPFALGLAQFTLVLLLLPEFTARPGLRNGLALGTAVASALFVHSVVGWSVALIAGAWWWWALWRSRRPSERSLRDVLLPLLVVFEAVLVVLLPYVALTTFGKEDTIRSGFSPRALGTWLLSGLILVPAGMTWLWRARRRVPGAADLLLAAVVLTLAGLSIWLPGENQSKFFNLLFLVLAAPAGLALVEFHRSLGIVGRTMLVTGLLLAVVPTVGVAVVAFATERGQLEPAWRRSSPALREAMRWARENTAPDAVFVDPTLGLDLPVRAHRSVISGGPRWEENWRYPAPALAVRRAAVAEVGSLGPTSPPVREFLNGLRRPVYSVLRRGDAVPSDSAWRASLAVPRPGYALDFANDRIAFFRWRSWE